MKRFNLIATIVFVALAMTSCGSKEDAKTTDTTVERIEKVKVQKMETSTITREVVLSATLQGYETQNVAPSVTGKIEHITKKMKKKIALLLTGCMLAMSLVACGGKTEEPTSTENTTIESSVESTIESTIPEEPTEEENENEESNG